MTIYFTRNKMAITKTTELTSINITVPDLHMFVTYRDILDDPDDTTLPLVAQRRTTRFSKFSPHPTDPESEEVPTDMSDADSLVQSIAAAIWEYE